MKSFSSLYANLPLKKVLPTINGTARLTPGSRFSGYSTGKSNGDKGGSINIGVRVAAGITTGALAVLFAQPTDVVKVRLQAGNSGPGGVRYTSTLQAYKCIALKEGTSGLWKGESELFFLLFAREH